MATQLFPNKQSSSETNASESDLTIINQDAIASLPTPSQASPTLLSPNQEAVSNGQIVSSEPSEVVAIDEVNLIPTIVIGELATKNASLVSVSPIFKPSANKSALLASVFAGPNYLQIKGESQSRSTGYTAGVNFVKRNGKWGIESGIEYTNLKYTTQTQKEILAGNAQQGFVGRTLHSIEFDIVSVPFKVTRKIFKA